jgi:hypothetical protein
MTLKYSVPSIDSLLSGAESLNGTGLIIDDLGNITGREQPNGKILSRILPIAVSGVKVSLTGSTNETLLHSIAIPDGAMGPNSALVIEPVFTYEGGTSSKSTYVRLGDASELLTSSQISAYSRTTQVFDGPLIKLMNRGNLTNQVSLYPGGTYQIAHASNAELTRSFDFSRTGLFIYISGQLTNASETINLIGVSAHILNPYN